MSDEVRMVESMNDKYFLFIGGVLLLVVVSECQVQSDGTTVLFTPPIFNLPQTATASPWQLK